MRRFWTIIAAAVLAGFTLTASANGASAAPASHPVGSCEASLHSWLGGYVVTADKARNTCDKVITTKAQAKRVRAWQHKKANRPTLKVWNWTGDGHKISPQRQIYAALCIAYLHAALDKQVPKAFAASRCDSLVTSPDPSRVTYHWEHKHPKAFKIWRFNPKH